MESKKNKIVIIFYLKYFATLPPNVSYDIYPMTSPIMMVLPFCNKSDCIASNAPINN